MKTFFALALLSTLFLAMPVLAARPEVMEFSGEGEVVTVDPLYSRVTIAHEPIKDVAADSPTDFVVESIDLLKNIHTRDRIEFKGVDTRGDVKIVSIKKIGVAAEKVEPGLGQAVQGALESTGGALQSFTEPIPPVHELTKTTTDAATGATGTVLEDADSQIKAKF